MKLQQTSAVVLALTLGSAGVAFGQEEMEAENSKLSVAADLAVVVPLGDWGDFSGIGVGPIVRAGFELQEKLQVTGRLGYIHHLAKDQGGTDLSTSEILILGGVRYDLGPAALDVATGLNLWSIKAEGGGVSVSETETRIPLMIGASVPVSMVELGASLLLPNLLLTEDGEDMQMGLMASVGYTFM